MLSSIDGPAPMSRFGFDYRVSPRLRTFLWPAGFVKDPYDWRPGRAFFLPLWPVPILWAVIWITRMIRAERRELKQWSGSLQEP